MAQWLADNGDPRAGPIDMVDWIELIPSGETRNYVQRVTENVVMYRAARNDSTPDPAGHAVDPLIHRISAWDGLPLSVREWSGGEPPAADPVPSGPGSDRR